LNINFASYMILYLTKRTMTKCDYCDKESVVEWKAWSAILCRDCAIKINRGLKKIMEEL